MGLHSTRSLNSNQKRKKKDDDFDCASLYGKLVCKDLWPHKGGGVRPKEQQLKRAQIETFHAQLLYYNFRPQNRGNRPNMVAQLWTNMVAINQRLH